MRAIFARCSVRLLMSLAAAMLTVPAAGGAGAQTPSVDRIIVNADTATRTLSPDFFGINYVGFWDSVQGSAASARALAQTPITVVRFAGGAPADWYDWADPYYKHWSSTSPLDLWRYARRLGGTVLFQTNYQGHLPNPPGKHYAVNSPQNAAAWVRYDRAHGIRAAMEVGNEEDLVMKKADDPAFQPYVDAFNAQARAMHAADPHVQVLGPAGTNEWQWWAQDSLGMFLKGTGNRTGSGQVDGVSLHFYKGSTWFDSKSVAQYWLSPSGPWAAIQRLIRAHDTRRLPVYITEWNLGSADTGNTFTPTLGHALATADMIGAFAQSGVTGEDYFDIHGASGWGLLYGAGEGHPADSPTPTYYALALWRHMGTRVLTLQQTDDPAVGISAYATRTVGGSYQVLAINKRSTPGMVQITFNGASAAGHHLTVYSLGPAHGSVADLDARYDGALMPSPQRRPLPRGRDGGRIAGRTLSYTVPGYTAVVLAVDRLSPGPRIHARLTRTAMTQPKLTVTATGAVSHPTATPGSVETLSATFRSNQDLGTVLADLEVYDDSNTKVFQATQAITLSAGSPVILKRRYTLSSRAYGGTYHYKVGIFGPNWSPVLAWNSRAGQFTVRGSGAPKVVAEGALAPSHVRPGDTVRLTAHITARGNGLTNALVDFEVYSVSGAKICQPVARGVTIRAGQTHTVTARCPIPKAAESGSYVLKIGVFGPNWSPLYTWNNGAATLAVGA